MYLKLSLISAIVLDIIPGACCYDYNIAGLVVSALFAFFLIIPIVVMLLMIVFWQNWYKKVQTKKGRIKMPRQYWRIFSKGRKQTHSAPSTPRSERKIPLRMTNLYVPGSKTTTISRPQEQPAPAAWMRPLVVSNNYEEKTQTLKFEPEEETMLVAEVLPDSQMRTSQLRTSQTPAYVISTSRNEPTFSGAQTSSYRVTEAGDTGAEAAYLSMTQSQSQYESHTSANPKPYHVQLTSVSNAGPSLSRTVVEPSSSRQQVPKLSQTIATTSGHSGDVFVSNKVRNRESPVNPGAGVMSFESENETEKVAPINQMEDVVLF